MTEEKKPPQVIVVDDEEDLRETISEYLGLHGFDVQSAASGAGLRDLLDSHEPDLVLLDLRMPGEDGLSLARFLRQHHDCAIVMLTAAGEVVDRVVGLELGADDYIPKPADLRELLARIKAVLRRSARNSRAAAAAPGGGKTIRFGRCMLDVDTRSLSDSQGDRISITSMEFDLLQAFAEHPNRVLSRDQLLDYAHHRNWEPFDRSIDVRIARLRRKIEDDPGNPKVITTVRGAGYMFLQK